jgi:hypothetical protein
MGAPHQPVQLFADPKEIDRAREAAAEAGAAEKKVVLPEVIPGFKANSLELGEVFPCRCAFFHLPPPTVPLFQAKALPWLKACFHFHLHG